MKLSVNEFNNAIKISSAGIKRPVRDACLYMGEASPPAPPTPPAAPAPPDPHFVFAIAPKL